jgi:hypothetical protein
MSDIDVCFKTFAWYDFEPESRTSEMLKEVTTFISHNAPIDLQHRWAICKNYFQFLRFMHENKHQGQEVLTSKNIEAKG